MHLVGLDHFGKDLNKGFKDYMAQATINKLKRASLLFRVPFLVLVYDFKNMRKYDKTSTDDELVEGIVEDLAEGAIS